MPDPGCWARQHGVDRHPWAGHAGAASLPKGRLMRRYSLLLSVTFHVAAALMLVIAPLVAATRLPDIRESISWVPARVATPPPLGDPNSSKPTSHSTPSATPQPQPQPQPIPSNAPSVMPEDPGIADASLPGFSGNAGTGPGVIDGEVGGDRSGIGVTPPPLPPPAPRAVEPRPPIRVGSGLVAPTKTRHVAPLYPPVALAAHREGTVILEAVIAEDGSVREVRVLRPVPLLDQAAIDAVRQWRFTPTLLNGEAVPIVMTVTVNFQLR